MVTPDAGHAAAASLQPELPVADGLLFREIESSGQPALVLFTSPQCEPCHVLEAVLARTSAAHSDGVRVVKLDVDRHTDLGQRYRIWVLPTLMQFCHGTHRRITARDSPGLGKVLRDLSAQAASGGTPGFREPPAIAHPAAPGLLPLGLLHPSLVPFGRDIAQLGIAPCLAEQSYALDGLICRIGENEAAGVRVGCGQILTNRHVFEQLAGERMEKAFTGRKLFAGRPELSGRAAPPPLPGGRLVMPWHFGRYEDWAVLDENPVMTCARPDLRSASMLLTGETLWIVGGSEGGRDLVTVGRLKSLKGVNGMLRECDVRPGMSGSAVIDTRGCLVGIFSTQFGWPGRRAMFVIIDAIVAGMEALRADDPGLPQFQFEPVPAAA